MIGALAFIPEKDVILAFNCIKEMPDLHSNLKNVLMYFEENYIGEPMRRKNARSLPRFPIKNWNQFENTVEGLARTNNHVEGWNGRFNAIVNAKKPTLSTIIGKMKAEHHNAEFVVERILANCPPIQYSNQKNIRFCKHIFKLCSEYDGKNILIYLRACTYHISS